MTGRKNKGQPLLRVVHGRSHLCSSLHLSTPSTPIGRIAARGNDLCTRLVGAARHVPRRRRRTGGKEAPGWGRGGNLEASLSLWRRVRERSPPVSPSAPETGQSSKGFDFGLFLRGGGWAGKRMDRRLTGTLIGAFHMRRAI